MSDKQLVRTSAKALIVCNDALLVTENKDANGTWFILPGGGQHQGETLTESLKRECLEEIGVEVEVGDLLFVREYIADNHEFHRGTEGLHQIDFIFQCTIDSSYQPTLGSSPDSIQSRVQWMPVDQALESRFFPKTLLMHLRSGTIGGAIYLGDVN